MSLITKTAVFHLKNFLYGTSSKVLNKLQYIQNLAAGLFTDSYSRNYTTHVLKNLYCLSISQCI